MRVFIWDFVGIDFTAIFAANKYKVPTVLDQGEAIRECFKLIAENRGINYAYGQSGEEVTRRLAETDLTGMFSGFMQQREDGFSVPDAVAAEDCVLISNRKELFRSAGRAGVRTCYLDDSVLFKLSVVESDYYCPNPGQLLSLVRYLYSTPVTFRAKQSLNTEYPASARVRISDEKHTPPFGDNPYDHTTYYAIDVRTGEPLYVSESSRPRGHGHEMSIDIIPSNFETVREIAKIGIDENTWRAFIGEKRIASALAKTKASTHPPVTLPDPPKRSRRKAPELPAGGLFVKHETDAVWLREKADGTWLFAVKGYGSFPKSLLFGYGYRPLENQALALLLNPEPTDSYEAYDRLLTKREIGYILDYKENNSDMNCVSCFFAIAAYGTQ